MKGGLDEVSLPNFVAAARGAVERSGAPSPTSRSSARCTRSARCSCAARRLGMREDQAVYLDDTGHMSGVDSLLGLDRAVRDGRLHDGDARAAPRGGHRLHVGREGRTVGREMKVERRHEFGPSSWIDIPQERIDAFAEATGDHQWIHVDPERRRQGRSARRSATAT